jgi:hypothetical protein
MKCNGDETLHDKYVTFMLRITVAEWELTKAVFIESGFIDSENNILNWDKRQFVSDSSAERVKRHREKKKQDDVTQCNVTVTPPEQNRTDTEQIQNIQDKPRKDKKSSDDITFDEFLESCKAKNEKPIPEDDPVYRWAEAVKLPSDFLFVGWRVFKSRNWIDSKSKPKKYKDWRAVFLNYCKNPEWLGVWSINRDGEYFLTAKGKQAQLEHLEVEA